MISPRSRLNVDRLRPITKLTAFAAVLGLVFAGAALAGAAIDPTDGQDATAAEAGHAAAPGGGVDAAHAGGEVEAGHEAGAGEVQGLAMSAGELSLEPERTIFTAGVPRRFSFRVVDEEGLALRDIYEREHGRELHLIVVSRDTATFRHLHPRRAADGTWSTELNLPRGGTYRAFADFSVDGARSTLATDLFVAGDYQPAPLPTPSASARIGGFRVKLDAGDAGAEEERRLSFEVRRPSDAAPPRLDDYLGAKAHLVALREGDLGYLHVHPVEGAADGGHAAASLPPNEVGFAATFPTAGSYRLFLQFKTGGQIRTVDYTVEVSR